MTESAGTSAHRETHPKTDIATRPASQPETRPETRRERLRRELTADILRIARRQLAEAGHGAVTWRAIARELGMNPASLYTYFDSLDDLFTGLILESYQRLAAAVDGAFQASEPTTHDERVERLMACAHAFRQWAVDHPAEFNLIFTDQIPGYAAPPAGPTYDAEMAVLDPLVKAAAALQGTTADPRAVSASAESDVDAVLGAWATMHGLVSLEVNHHLPDGDAAQRFDRIIRATVSALGG